MSHSFLSISINVDSYEKWWLILDPQLETQSNRPLCVPFSSQLLTENVINLGGAEMWFFALFYD